MRYFTLHGVAEAEGYTFKAIRVGKATQMAAQGFTLGEICIAGEWKALTSVLQYVRDDVADAVELLRQMIEMNEEGEAGEVAEE